MKRATKKQSPARDCRYRRIDRRDHGVYKPPKRRVVRDDHVLRAVKAARKRLINRTVERLIEALVHECETKAELKAAFRAILEEVLR